MPETGRRCPNCSKTILKGDTRCSNCGEPLAVGHFGSSNPAVPLWLGRAASIAALLFPLVALLGVLCGLGLWNMHDDLEGGAQLTITAIIFGFIGYIIQGGFYLA